MSEAQVHGSAALDAQSTERECVRVRCAELLQRLQPMLDAPSDNAAMAFEEACTELGAIPVDKASEDLVECLIAIAQHYYLANQPSRALHPGAQAVLHARELADKAVLRNALSILGVIRTETGDLPGATHAYTEALQLAAQDEDFLVAGKVWNNLGIALMSAAQYRDALKCFKRASMLVKGTTTLEHAALEHAAMVNMAQCARHLRDVRTGIRSARRALELNQNPTSAHDCLNRVIAEAEYSRLLLEVGETGHAQEHCDAARQFAVRAQSAKAQYVASQISGLVDVHSDRVDIGLTRLKKGLEVARKSASADVRDALAVCVAGYEAAGQRDVALLHLKELLELNRETHAARILKPFEALANELGATVGADLQYEGLLASKAIKLHREVDRCLDELLSTAADNALRAGHDALRPARVARLAELFARSRGWDDAAAGSLSLSVKLMDVGALVVPDALWRKSRGLSEGERKLVGQHTGFGADLLQRARLALLQPCVAVAKYHHERWDGGGVWGLAGAAIPIEARVAAIVDAVDALTHARPWRPAKTMQAALRIIGEEAGTKFDPELTQQFVTFLHAEYWRHDDWDDFLASEADSNAYVKARLAVGRLLAAPAEDQP